MIRPRSALRRVAVAGTLVLACAMVTPGTALAGILSDATTTSVVQTARWSAIPAAPGGTSVTSSFAMPYGEKQTRYALVDVYNTGSVSISGFTITGTRTGSGNATVESCASGWTPPAKAKDAPLCNGATNGGGVGTLVPGGGLSVAATIPPGGRVSLRIMSQTGTWNLSVAVTV